MMKIHNILSKQIYLDLDYEDLPIPLYLRKQFDKLINTNDVPSMFFSGTDTVMKVCIANAIAKKLNMEVEGIEFTKEPRNKSEGKGGRTLHDLRELLDIYTQNGIRKFLIIDDTFLFPASRHQELADIILSEKKHRFLLFTGRLNPINDYLKFLPKIAITFPIDHSPKERENHLKHTRMLLSKYNITRTDEEFQTAIDEHGSTGHAWADLLGKPFMNERKREINNIEIVKRRLKVQEPVIQ